MCLGTTNNDLMYSGIDRALRYDVIVTAVYQQIDPKHRALLWFEKKNDIVKQGQQGYTYVYLFFLFLLQNIDCG